MQPTREHPLARSRFAADQDRALCGKHFHRLLLELLDGRAPSNKRIDAIALAARGADQLIAADPLHFQHAV